MNDLHVPEFAWRWFSLLQFGAYQTYEQNVLAELRHYLSFPHASLLTALQPAVPSLSSGHIMFFFQADHGATIISLQHQDSQIFCMQYQRSQLHSNQIICLVQYPASDNSQS